ncbi:MAG: thioredoxin family protein [Desulfobacterales bacterium]
MEIIKLENAQAFDQTTERGVCLVDFNAPWCGPCKAQTPIIEELAGKFDVEASVAELDVSANREVAKRLGVYSIPTLIVFKDGKELMRFVGLQPKEVLEGALKQAIGTGS